MESVYSRTQKVMVDLSNEGSNVLYLPLDRMRSPISSSNIDLNNLSAFTSSPTSNTASAPSLRVDARSRGGR
jgi:membrane protease subunit HflK